LSRPRRTVRVSLPLDLVLAAERELRAVFQEAVPGFKLTRDVFAAVLFEHAYLDLVQDYYSGKGKDRRVMPGPNRKEAFAIVRGYVVALFEGHEFDVGAPRRRRPRR
jgi:hypothetical protein